MLKEAAEPGDPGQIGARSFEWSLVAATVAVPLAIGGAAFFSPWFLGALAVPFLVFVAPELGVRDRINQRREGAEAELPFFSLVVNVLAEAGVPLYQIMEAICNGDFFTSMKKEAKLVRRDVLVLGMNPVDSIERLASHHPSISFRDFLVGYTSKVRSGGDVDSYLSAASGSLLSGLEEGWEAYVSRVGIVGSIMITAFGVVPLLLMVAGIFSPALCVIGLVLYAGVGIPLITVGLVVLAGRIQPLRLEEVRGRTSMGLVAVLPAVAAGVYLDSAWEALALGSMAFFLGYGISVRAQISELREFDRGLARFLNDVLEFKRKDYDLGRAILAIRKSTQYTPPFDRALSKVAAELRMGIPLDEVRITCRSRMGKLTFHLIGQMSRTGGGTVVTVHQLSSFVDKVNETRRRAAAEMKPYAVLSYLSPLILAFGVAFVSGVSTSFGGTLLPAAGAAPSPLLEAGRLSPLLEKTADLLTVASSVSLGLIGSKITDMTVRNTVKASTNVALAAVAVGIANAIGTHSLAHLL